jgi:hypothetical protein
MNEVLIEVHLPKSDMEHTRLELDAAIKRERLESHNNPLHRIAIKAGFR